MIDKLGLFVWAFFFLSLEQFAQTSLCRDHKRMIPTRGGMTFNDPGNLRSDTLDVLSYDINLDMTLMNSSIIKGNCSVTLQCLQENINGVNLDLRSLDVDSVKLDNTLLTFSHVGEVLHIALPSATNAGDIFTLNVYYQGTPGLDESWGGFYFQSGYAYNIGVAFTSEPHNFGRVWFPCFDNFVERSSFTFHVLTNQNRKAYCNGMRTGVEVVGQDSIITHWQLNEQIPSYLATVSVTNYAEALDSFQSISGEEIPVYMIARAIDTTAMKQSLINIPAWMEAAETRFGPYRWPRLGYCAVPFIAGAMEHATNISYPLYGLDGSLDFETTAAHEAAHHWWGDLVTCRNADDMWINEGWASYCEALYMEMLYDDAAYIDYVRDNHKDVLLFAHIRDGARYPVSGVPSEATYGDHVYNKGADMAHTLRSYMGDEDFFEGLRDFLDVYQFNDVVSEDLRDHLQTFTDADLTSFFENWIFEGGFPEFRVREFSNASGNTWNVEIDQHKHYATDYYSNVPIQVSATNAVGVSIHEQFIVSGESSVVSMTLPDGFLPEVFFLNTDDAISQAVLGETKWLTELGANDFDFAEFDLDVNDFGGMDSIFMRVENHWAAPNDQQVQPEFFISPDRWWSVYHNGVNSSLSAAIRYYGNDGSSNYYDPQFFDYLESTNLNEDSIVLVYRASELVPWQEWNDYNVFTIPGLTNWTGRIDIENVTTGQYAFAVRTGVNAVHSSNTNKLNVYQDGKFIVVQNAIDNAEIAITDASGRLVYSGKVNVSERIPCELWSRGLYTIQWKQDGEIAKKVNKIVLR
jgi:hypothetical protein